MKCCVFALLAKKFPLHFEVLAKEIWFLGYHLRRFLRVKKIIQTTTGSANQSLLCPASSE